MKYKKCPLCDGCGKFRGDIELDNITVSVNISKPLSMNA